MLCFLTGGFIVALKEILASGRAGRPSYLVILFFFFFAISCSVPDLTSLPKDQTCAPCTGSMEH